MPHLVNRLMSAQTTDFCHVNRFQSDGICLPKLRACEPMSIGCAPRDSPDGWRFPQGQELKPSLQLPHLLLLLLSSKGPSVYFKYVALTIWPWENMFFSIRHMNSPIHPSIHPSSQKKALSGPEGMWHFNPAGGRHSEFEYVSSETQLF